VRFSSPPSSPTASLQPLLHTAQTLQDRAAHLRSRPGASSPSFCCSSRPAPCSLGKS
jgi:hypothetical protein